MVLESVVIAPGGGRQCVTTIASAILLHRRCLFRLQQVPWNSPRCVLFVFPRLGQVQAESFENTELLETRGKEQLYPHSEAWTAKKDNDQQASNKKHKLLVYCPSFACYLQIPDTKVGENVEESAVKDVVVVAVRSLLP